MSTERQESQKENCRARQALPNTSGRRLRPVAFAVSLALSLSAVAEGNSTTSTVETAADTNPPAAGGRNDLEEVVVTATKRSERAIDIPESISAIGGDYLQKLHVTGLADLASQVPGMLITSGGSPGSTSITLRGLDSQGNGALVSTLIDDAAVGSSGGWAAQDSLQLDLLPDDIQRIEVLRGPQGTIWGANSMGGVVRYVTVDPDLNNDDVFVGADTFLYAGAKKPGYGGHLTVNKQLEPGTLALRASVYDRETPGNYYNPLLGTRYENPYSKRGGRLALMWHPSDTLSVRMQGFYSEVSSANSNVSRAELIGTTPPLSIGDPIDGRLTFRHILPQPTKNRVLYTSATVNWDAGFADLTSVTSYSDTQAPGIADLTPSYLATALSFDSNIGPNGAVNYYTKTDTKKLAQELRLSSKAGGPLDWLGGVYATHEKAINLQIMTVEDAALKPVDAVNPLYYDNIPTTYDELAAFANFTYHFTKSFELSAGLRESSVRQKFRDTSDGLGYGGFSDAIASSHENVFVYAVSPSYHMNANSMVYFRVATGYRPGQEQATYPQYPEIPSQINSDRTTNYELGFKGDLLDRSLTLDVAAYQINWTRVQVLLSTPDGAINYGVNGASAVSKGMEASLGYTPIQPLHLGITSSYNKAYFTESAPGSELQKGAALSLSPKWTGSLFANVTPNPIGRWRPSLSANVRYIGSTFNQASTSVSAVQVPAYVVADASAGVDDGNTRISLYVRNIANKYAYSTVYTTTDNLTGATYAQGSTIPQRTIGVSIDKHF
ncbi:MAG: TonB-dependent receptor [Proteobacteria bacterium]|nr:TonB-dependent receptor [Pseudomonadota bacterium]